MAIHTSVISVARLYYIATNADTLVLDADVRGLVQERPASSGVPVLTLANDSLNIRIVGINGAVIGRRKGPYTQFFEQHAYVSGVHAQLKYKSGSGWVITDKHSSNGTKVNQRPLQPDVDMALHNGDILTIANVNLQVIVR